MANQPFTVKIEGIKELQATFKQLDNELQNALSEAVSAGAAVVERDAKMRVVRVTGNLANSIKELQQIKSGGRVESQVGSDMEYAARIEFGYTGPDKLGRIFHQGAQPYLRPALDENKAEIQAAFEKKIQQIIARYK